LRDNVATFFETASGVKIAIGAKFIGSITSNVRFVRPKAFPAVIYPFNDMVLIDNSSHKPYQLFLQCGVLDFKDANGRPSRGSLCFAHKDHEHILSFDEVSDKLAWLAIFM
jgi:hypothetical protein